jgi:serine/threonine protein kinase
MNAPETEVIVTKDGTEILRTKLVPGEYTIGREAGCELVLPVDGVSRKHAKLTINFDNAFIEDLKSSNGTFVADRKVTESTRLFPNQTIKLGTATMHLRRQKFTGPPESLSPHSAAVQRYLAPEFLRERKYDIAGIIAEGGMGAIVDAQDTILRRKVAMKVMLQTGSQEQLVRFIEEAQVTGQLEHPNIVPVYELGVDEQEQVFYTMKMVRGITLHQVLHLIETGVPGTLEKYPLAALLALFQKICDALAFAHSKGVIHRDLKPANVMLGEYGEVLVMDWGLARASGRNEAGDGPMRTLVRSARQDEGEAMMTMAGMVLGTPQYMPPEQALGETDKFDARTDIYSLGAILYHILTLEPPIKGEDVGQMLQSVAAGQVAPQVAATGPRHVHSSRPLPHIPGGKIPEALAVITRKAMAMKQEDRYQTVKELQAAIQTFQAGSPAPQASPAPPIPSGKDPIPAPKKSNTLVIVAAAAIVLLMGLCVKLIVDRGRLEAALREAQNAAGPLKESGKP